MNLPMYPDHNRCDSIDELTEIAGAAEEPPQPPADGIPRQWLPNLLRWPIRVLVLPFVHLSLVAQWIASKIIRPPYRQEGQCYQRGNCCYFVLLPAPKTFLARIFYLWHTQVNGFFPRRKESIQSEGQEVVIMGCRYLKKDGRCGHYRLRPTLCREWPLIEYFRQPRILKGCGFKAVPREKSQDS